MEVRDGAVERETCLVETREGGCEERCKLVSSVRVQRKC